MPKYIFVGNSGSGKDTIADIIGLPKYALATSLKDLSAIIFRVDRRRFEGGWKDRPFRRYYRLTARDLLKRVAYEGFFDIPALQAEYELGQLAIDNYCLQLGISRPVLQRGGIKKTQPNFFIDILKKTIDFDSYIITDIRTQLEFDAFKDDVISVAIERGNLQGDKYLHHTEQLRFLKSQCQFTFNNHFQNLEELKEAVRSSEIFNSSLLGACY